MDGLAIEDRCVATEVGSRVYDRGIALAPIVSIASENPRRSLLKQYLASIAVVFEFVNPVIPLWRLIDRGSKLGFDEPKACGYGRHGDFVAAELSVRKEAVALSGEVGRLLARPLHTGSIKARE